MTDHRSYNRAVAKSASLLRVWAVRCPSPRTRQDKIRGQRPKASSGICFSFEDLLRTLRHAGVFDTHRHYGLLTFSWRAIDCIGNFESGNHAPKRREFSVEVRLVTNQNEEMRGSTIGFVPAGHRHNSAHVLNVTRLVRQMTGHSFS